MALYTEKEANFPRLKTDACFANYSNEYKYDGFIDGAFDFVAEKQLKRRDLWKRFAYQFKERPDGPDRRWRGEYWGKMMRGASFVYSYSRDAELYEILRETVLDMLSCEDEYGRISSYSVDLEFDGWDVWCRKYVLLGMQYFLEISDDDELNSKIVASMCRQVDYLISKIGKKSDGKKPITDTTNYWRGLNSSSLLEPIVRLYTITGEERYFDFAKYIVDVGATDVANIFDLAYENKLAPYEYPVVKAYEMTSCFEGLLEFYRITGIERYKTALINYAEKMLETDFTVIGSSGCTHELFDHSTARQADPSPEDDERMQETCVTVTLMKFFYQMTLLTGDGKYVDAFERALYNAYLGALNTEDRIDRRTPKEFVGAVAEPMPFDSYSPLRSGMRGSAVGGSCLMSDGHYYGCCACIGSAGIGLVPKMQIMTTKVGISVGLYINGSVNTQAPSGEKLEIITETDYPKNGKITVFVNPDVAEKFTVSVRIPAWSGESNLSVNGEKIQAEYGFVSINREWKRGDKIELTLDMRTAVIYPTPYGENTVMTDIDWASNLSRPVKVFEHESAKDCIALRRGPVMLAIDARLGRSPDDVANILVGNDGFVSARDAECAPAFDHLLALDVPTADGKFITLVDYQSAGKTLDEESKMAVWIKNR